MFRETFSSLFKNKSLFEEFFPEKDHFRFKERLLKRHPDLSRFVHSVTAFQTHFVDVDVHCGLEYKSIVF